MENAAPLCTLCHDTYGHSRNWRAFIRNARDWWWDKVEKIYGPKQISEIERIVKPLLAEEATTTRQAIEEAKKELIRHIDFRIEELTYLRKKAEYDPTPGLLLSGIGTTISGGTGFLVMVIRRNLFDCYIWQEGDEVVMDAYGPLRLTGSPRAASVFANARGASFEEARAKLIDLISNKLGTEIVEVQLPPDEKGEHPL